MKITSTAIPDVKLVTPTVFGDARGYFFEAYHFERFRDAGIDVAFVQDNQSLSAKNILRGLHYQLAPKAQSKLVRVISGKIFDVAVDIRPESPTYGKWAGEILSAENHRMLFIPKGFAHGFYTLEDQTIVLYKCDDFYAPELERGIRWDDAALGIDWPIIDGEVPRLSPKDAGFGPFISG